MSKKYKRIGEIALEEGILFTPGEVEHILEIQRRRRNSGERTQDTLFGQLLKNQEGINEEQVQALLQKQREYYEGETQLRLLFWELKCRHKPFQFGDYWVHEFVNCGGMGEVYKAQKANRSFALKIIRLENDSDKLRSRFSKEMKALAKFSHPNIVAVDGYGENAGIKYLAMEYLEGDPLDKAVLSNDLSYREWLEKFVRLLLAIEEIHQAGTIHRDLKPSNIIFTGDRLVLIDFGICKELEMPTLLTTQPIGTLSYMAPEQIDNGEQDRRTDIWALGVILYQILTRELPFQGKSNSQVISRIHRQKPKSILKCQTGFPRQLDSICKRALQKKKEKRYQSASEMANEIQQVLFLPPARPRTRRKILAVASLTIVVLIALFMVSPFPRKETKISPGTEDQQREQANGVGDPIKWQQLPLEPEYQRREKTKTIVASVKNKQLQSLTKELRLLYKMSGFHSINLASDSSSINLEAICEDTKRLRKYLIRKDVEIPSDDDQRLEWARTTLQEIREWIKKK